MGLGAKAVFSLNIFSCDTIIQYEYEYEYEKYKGYSA